MLCQSESVFLVSTSSSTAQCKVSLCPLLLEHKVTSGLKLSCAAVYWTL